MWNQTTIKSENMIKVCKLQNNRWLCEFFLFSFVKMKTKTWSQWMAMGTNGVDGPASQPVAADGRMAELEALFLGGPLMAGNMHGAKSFSIETLLDILVVLFDECSNSSLRREKTVSEFIELGKSSLIQIKVFLCAKLKSSHLCVESFQTWWLFDASF